MSWVVIHSIREHEDGQNLNNASGRKVIPPDMRALFDRMDESTRQVRQMTTTQWAITEENYRRKLLTNYTSVKNFTN